ncbi:DEAD/DEAH box helicase family protein [Clostridium tarantellae]|uniref:DEAD/DEAH box helicase n=1 Tax=Clostridium tarantellae TaxID=39493 RepID=A0A6I1MPP7_9CLOT|nr:DEAD/DEAH box helicase family protein [Clostridium tarantellae]MPQ42851.1 DEAD/DEAH box helicase [Clostridium tarantellae]
MITSVKEFNNNINIEEVIYKLHGITIDKTGDLICPIHGTSHKKKKFNSSIDRQKNIFRCWTKNCTNGAVTPYGYIDYYLRNFMGMTDFKEVYKFIDDTFKTNLHKEFNYEPKKKNTFSKVIKVNEYCSEVLNVVLDEVIQHKNILLNAGTGTGKTRALAEGVKENFKNLGIDKVIYITPRASIVEEIEHTYKYKGFYKNDSVLPCESHIVATSHKAPLINLQMDIEYINFMSENREIILDKSTNYMLIIDEAHLLLSARNIIGNVKEIEKLIANAKYNIFTSANTEHFYNACKDVYNIKNHISIERKLKKYNLENLYVKRIDSNKEVKRKYLKELCKTEKNKKLIIYNNIYELKILEKELKSEGLDVALIYSDIKDNNDTIDFYKGIIEESTLKADITLCTSVIDTGININDNNVTTILIESNNTLDDITINQSFARVRTTKGNKGYLILDTIKNKTEKHSIISKFNSFLHSYMSLSKLTCDMFNEHMFNNYDSESFEEYKTVWNILSGNDMYKPYADLLKIETDQFNINPRMTIDSIKVYNKARKQHLQNNYYNDNFILSLLDDINAKSINLSYVEIDKPKEKEEKEDVKNFNNDLKKIIDNNDNIVLLINKYNFNINFESLNNTDINNLIKNHRSKLKKLDKRVSNMIKLIDNKNIEVSKAEYIIDMYNAYSLEKALLIKKRVNEIEYPIYNKLYLNGDFTGIGDIIYISIRKNCDCFIKNRNIVTKTAINTILAEIINYEKGYWNNEEKCWYDKNDKPVKINKYKKDIIKNIELIYDCSKEFKIYKLK